MTTSTINPSNPPANTPLASSVVRANFLAAYTDITALWAALGGLVTGVSSFNARTGAVTLNNTDVVNALGFNPHTKMGNLHWITPINSTISLVPYAEYSFTVSGLNNLVLSAGSLTLSFLINGVAITGLNNIAVTTITQSPSASALNLVNVGNEVTMVVTNCISAANLKFSMAANV